MKPTIVLIALMLPLTAMGHDVTVAGSFHSGLLHPVFGLDHLLTFLCFAFLGNQNDISWNVLFVLVVSMFLGTIIGFQSSYISYIEYAIGVSVIVSGLVVGYDKKLKHALVYILASVFAIFHGYAHGVEMPYKEMAFEFVAGFLTGLSIIYGIGILIWSVLQKSASLRFIKWLGWGVFAWGVYAFVFLY
ncbi:HupE/UreJ family protein [Reichenbachiella versicolor]|uniref:HupE/UreJ family protein n=1 Tax=Reichenbachiella versicolor TaxID=1821036 RepID=UPI000D6E3C3A|nr:HupE/UreJ family protein [Reichenbachiella versicolor]